MSQNYEQFQSMRREYIQQAFTEEDAHSNPVQQFKKWFDLANQKLVDLPNAMTLSTASSTGQASSRMVLLKHYDEEGFNFFTNYESQKAKDLDGNPQVALLFYWSLFDRQVRLEGHVAKVSREESENYFSSRPRDSQIAAMSSAQSSVAESRGSLEKDFIEKKSELSDEVEINCPDNWGGYRVKVARFEFWQGRENRLHDRLVYERKEGQWKIQRLAP